MKKNNLKRMLSVIFSAFLALSLLAGCGSSQDSDVNAAGTVLLSVNPEIEVEYDDGGLVLEIEGINDDGKKIAAQIDDYKGKDCRTVVNELVKKIYEADYFDKTVDGHTKNIVLKLGDGSACPNDDFLDDVADAVREAVKTCGIDSAAMTVDADDLNEKGLIGQDKAMELVLAQLGFDAASFNNHEYELDDGVYEFEFSVDGVEYEYEVDANTGKILKADFDGNDDWDDMDDWDDWEDFVNDDDDDDDQDKDDDDDDSDDDQDKDDDDDDDDDNSVSIPVGGRNDDDDDDRDDDKDKDDDDDDRDDDNEKDDDDDRDDDKGKDDDDDRDDDKDKDDDDDRDDDKDKDDDDDRDDDKDKDDDDDRDDDQDKDDDDDDDDDSDDDDSDDDND